MLRPEIAIQGFLLSGNEPTGWSGEQCKLESGWSIEIPQGKVLFQSEIPQSKMELLKKPVQK